VVTAGVVVTGLLALLVLIALDSPNGLFFKNYRSLYVSVPDPGNLLPHSDVRVHGLLVGQVEGTSFANGRALVHIQLNGDAQPLPVDTTALIRAQGLLGQRYVELDPGQSPRDLANGARISVGANALTYGVPDALDTFDQQTRGGFGQMLDALGVGLLGRGAQLNTMLGVAPASGSDFLTAARAILAQPGAVARLIPALQTAAQAFDNARHTIVDSLGPAVATLTPFVVNRAAFAATLQYAPPTLAVAQPALARGVQLLRAATALTTAAERTLPAAPVGLRDTTILLRSSHRALVDTAQLLSAAHPTVPAVLETTSSLAPLLRPLQTTSTSADPIVTSLGQHGCDLYNMASNWRSALGYAVSNSAGPNLPSGNIGDFNFFRVTIIAGPASVHGLASPSLDPGTVDVYPPPCQYAPGPKYFDPLAPSQNGAG
jgi:phospholipid/cholesterol/gamma-HCH transport system substrate-binding protein